MTVNELIEELKKFNGDLKICFYNCRYDEDLPIEGVFQRKQKGLSGEGDEVVVIN